MYQRNETHKEDLLELLSNVDDDADIGIFIGGRFVSEIRGIKDMSNVKPGDSKTYRNGEYCSKVGRVNEGGFGAALIADDGWDYGEFFDV